MCEGSGNLIRRRIPAFGVGKQYDETVHRAVRRDDVQLAEITAVEGPSRNGTEARHRQRQAKYSGADRVAH